MGQNARQALRDIDKLLYQKLPEVLRQTASSICYKLLDDFYTEYEKLKDFAVYRSLGGKNIVGLGGNFSSGKIGFLNALMGSKGILPESMESEVYIPTYLVHSKETVVKAIDLSGNDLELDIKALPELFHPLENRLEGVHWSGQRMLLGKVLKSLLLETDRQKYENLVFWNTMNYGAAESDEQKIRQQLNTSDFILWFLPVDEMDAIPDSELEFLKTLNPEIPIMVVCTRANQRAQEERERIKTLIREQILLENLNVEHIFFFDARTPKGLNTFGIYKVFSEWNQLNGEKEAFARSFKRFFEECRSCYQRKNDEADKEITDLLNVLFCLDISDQTSGNIEHIKEKIQKEDDFVEQQKKELLRIQNAFFDGIRDAAEEAGIYIPEDIEALEDKITNSLDILKYYNKRYKRQTDPMFRQDILDVLGEVQPAFDCEPGGRRYKVAVRELLDEIMGCEAWGGQRGQ
ncbi:MAG: GTPase domain-containing protein [Lachnospiraceae bacterium]|nr:GTPase domain-containing protein [Lachnospiraceae bacterium]